MEKWKSEGGLEKVKQAKKEAKKAAKAAAENRREERKKKEAQKALNLKRPEGMAHELYNLLYTGSKEKRAKKKKKKAEKASKPKKSSGCGGGEKRAKKKKMTKIEGQPKRATSSYFIWMNATREEIIADLPSGSSRGDISKSAAEGWKSMSDPDKKVTSST